MANPKPSPCVENPANPNNTGISGDWPCYENTGTTASDVSSGGHNATLSGGATWTPGAWGPAVSVSGGSSLNMVFPAVAANQPFTLLIGHEPSNYPGGFTTLLDDPGRLWSIFLSTGGQGSFSNNLGWNWGTVGPTGAIPPTGAQYRMAIVRDTGTTYSFYLNGAFITTLTGSASAISSTTVYFGENISGGGQSSGTLISGVKLYVGTQLTAAQIAQDAADWFACYRAISPIQSSTLSTATSTSSITASFGVLPTVGNAVIAHIWGFTAGGTTPNLFDNQSGNSYSEVVLNSDFIGNEYSGQWLLPAVVTSAGTFTVSASGTFTIVNMFLEEFNPGLTADQVNSANGSSSAPAAGAVTTSIADELIALTFGSLDASNPAVIAQPGGFYLDQQQLAGGLGGQIVGGGAYEAVSTTQSGINPAWATDTSARWAAVVGTYKITSSPPPPPPPGDVFPDWLLQKVYYEVQEEIIYQ